jgi:hypothetical protein
MKKEITGRRVLTKTSCLDIIARNEVRFIPKRYDGNARVPLGVVKEVWQVILDDKNMGAWGLLANVYPSSSGLFFVSTRQ